SFIMKKISLLIFSIVAFVSITNAQDKKHTQSKKVKAHHYKQRPQVADSTKLSNRKIYHWKDGQRSTPTGHKATPSNGSQYAALHKDTATLPKKHDQ
ncbi:MAG TPA: hypothetical protein VJ499_16620, partial [Flavisolibacter sp.]|nr:hypothetical protein [Flavisolibacter sp.]